MDKALAAYADAGERSARAYSEFACANMSLHITVFAEVMKFMFSFLPRSVASQSITEVITSSFGDHRVILTDVAHWRARG